MAANGWAHVRVAVPLERSRAALATEVVGDGRTRLRVRLDHARPATPLRGALSYPATWRAGRRSGDAVVSVIPQWSWGYELHLAVSAPHSIAGRISWPRRRLERLAGGLAVAMKDAAERSARTTEARPERMRRWSFVSASGTPSSR